MADLNGNRLNLLQAMPYTVKRTDGRTDRRTDGFQEDFNVAFLSSANAEHQRLYSFAFLCVAGRSAVPSSSCLIPVANAVLPLTACQ